MVHKYYHTVFTSTRNRKYGFDVLENAARTWGTDTVRPLIDYMQRIIDQISDVLKFLCENLPESKR